MIAVTQLTPDHRPPTTDHRPPMLHRLPGSWLLTPDRVRLASAAVFAIMAIMIWTISDLHLSSVHPKPMDIFGDRWREHPQRIAAAWRERVQPNDSVLVAGDISWAMHLGDALPDLRWIDALPGRKVLIRGNHDYWWPRTSLNLVRKHAPPSLTLLNADAVVVDEVVICGTRGWMTPGTNGFDPLTDKKIYERELRLLDRALAAATTLAEGTRPIVVMIHYPPFLDRRPTEFSRRICASGAAACIYGHLHRQHDWNAALQGVVDGVYYQLTSCDYLKFGPVGVRGIPDSSPTTDH